MSETVFWTVGLGFATFVLGQIVLKLLIEPIVECKKTLGEIANSLVMYAPEIYTPGVVAEDAMHKVSEILRGHASQLNQHMRTIPMYRIVRRIFFLPSNVAMRESISCLIGLSNGLYRADGNIHAVNAKRVDRICDLLKIEQNPGDRYPDDESKSVAGSW